MQTRKGAVESLHSITWTEKTALSSAGHSGGQLQDYFLATGFQGAPLPQRFIPNGLLYLQLNSPITPSIPGKMQKNRHFSPSITEPGNAHTRHQEYNERVKQKVHSKYERYTSVVSLACAPPQNCFERSQTISYISYSSKEESWT